MCVCVCVCLGCSLSCVSVRKVLFSYVVCGGREEKRKDIILLFISIFIPARFQNTQKSENQ